MGGSNIVATSFRRGELNSSSIFWHLAVVVDLVGGGGAYFQYYVHRLFLTQSRALPWRAFLFLEEETGCILLQRVGGGYRFIRPLLQEHFASLKPSSAQTRGFSKAEKWVHESSV